MELNSLISSITGFHNPKKHTGLSPEEFLLMYVRRQATLSRTKKDKTRIVWVLVVLDEWDAWCLKVKEYFPTTLK